MCDVGPADATLLYWENKQANDFLEILLCIWKFLNLEMFAIFGPPFREITRLSGCCGAENKRSKNCVMSHTLLSILALTDQALKQEVDVSNDLQSTLHSSEYTGSLTTLPTF